MIAILSDDLIDSSKIIADARRRGETARQCRTAEAILSLMEGFPVTEIVVDLQHPQLDLTAIIASISGRNPRPKLVAYGSHVAKEQLQAARAAGCDEVHVRSKYLG